MTSNPSGGTEPLMLVSRIAAALPSLSATELDELADAVEALTDAIGLQRDWPPGQHPDVEGGGLGEMKR